MQKTLKRELQWHLDGLSLAFGDYLKEVLCWPALNAKQVKANQAFRDALKRNCFNRPVYERLLKEHGAPSPKILKAVEGRIGGPLELLPET